MSSSFPAFSRWVACGLRNHIQGLLFDRENDDLVLHFLDPKGKPPYHRRILFAEGAFKSFEQKSDTDILTARQNKIQDMVDADLIKELANACNTKKVLTHVQSQESDLQFELDGYVPSCSLWLELTTLNNPLKNHLPSKFFTFSCLKAKSVKAYIHEFDEKQVKPIKSTVKIRVKKMLYISLFPVPSTFAGSLNDLKIINILEDENFYDLLLVRAQKKGLPERLQEKWNELISAFHQMCSKYPE